VHSGPLHSRACFANPVACLATKKLDPLQPYAASYVGLMASFLHAVHFKHLDKAKLPKLCPLATGLGTPAASL